MAGIISSIYMHETIMIDEASNQKTVFYYSTYHCNIGSV